MGRWVGLLVKLLLWLPRVRAPSSACQGEGEWREGLGGGPGGWCRVREPTHLQSDLGHITENFLGLSS